MRKLFLATALFCSIASAQTHFVGTTNGWAPWSGSDKMMHFSTGVPGGMLTGVLLKNTKHPILYTFLVGSAVGLAHEECDRRGWRTPFGPSGKAEWADAFNTALGFALGAAFDVYVIGVSVHKETLPNGKSGTNVSLSYRIAL